MKVKVTEQGVVVPKELLEGVEEVEIRKENNLIVVVPATNGDPIMEFGKHPVICSASDASEHHDKYIYGSST
ncbi:MAG: hypothetical protein AB1611_18020 [bacterium]